MHTPEALLTGNEALSADSAFEYIVPYTYSSNIEMGANRQLKPVLSVLSRMALDAAAHAHVKHPNAKIVIAGETTYPGLATTTSLMVERAVHDHGIDARSLVPLEGEDGRGLNNTYLQTERLAQFFDPLDGAQNALFIALGYHMPRVAMTADAYGLQPGFAIAEDILQAAGVDEYDKYAPYIEKLEKSEKALRLINRVDRKGKLLNLFMQISGPRLVDVEEGPNGLQVIETFADQKRRALSDEIRQEH